LEVHAPPAARSAYAALPAPAVPDPHFMNLKNALLQRLLARWSSRSVTITDPAPAPAPAPSPAPSAAPTPAPRLNRLDIQAAIIEHLEWCVQFNERLSRDHTPIEAEAALPGASDSGLGQWLARSQHGAPGQHPLFAEIEREHTRFHELADKALSLADSGHMHLASTLLNTDFERSRARLLELLRTLQRS
jgi:hypothetical protein